MAHVHSIEDFDFTHKRVLVRVDYNVPLSGGRVDDDFRIRASLKTLNRVLDGGGSLVLMSHLGRPAGNGPEPEFSMRPVADRLRELLGRDVDFVDNCVGESVQVVCDSLRPGGVVLLENLRFHKGEKKGDAGFGKQLAALADIYISDAFGTAHRSDASMTVPPQHMPAGAGYLMLAEIQYLGGLVDNPERPFIAILGGAKVSDKLPIIESLIGKVDALCIGGAMAYTFMAAKGEPVGDSLVERDLIDTAERILDRCKEAGIIVELPVDHVVSTSIDDTDGLIADGIPDGKAGFDIGPGTLENFRREINRAKAVLYNGPPGVFEKEDFSQGTRALVELIAEAPGTTVVGGGDAASSVRHFGVADRITHVSTGGGASLELLAGNTLPGIAVLEAAAKRMAGS